jgi:hypothetical protein
VTERLVVTGLPEPRVSRSVSPAVLCIGTHNLPLHAMASTGPLDGDENEVDDDIWNRSANYFQQDQQHLSDDSGPSAQIRRLSIQRRWSNTDHSLASYEPLPPHNEGFTLPGQFIAVTVFADVTTDPHGWILPRQQVRYTMPGTNQSTTATLELTHVALVPDVQSHVPANRATSTTSNTTATFQPGLKRRADSDSLLNTRVEGSRQQQRASEDEVLLSFMRNEIFESNANSGIGQSSHRGIPDAVDLEPIPLAPSEHRDHRVVELERPVLRFALYQPVPGPVPYSVPNPPSWPKSETAAEHSLAEQPPIDNGDINTDASGAVEPLTLQPPHQTATSVSNDGPMILLKPLTAYNYFYRMERDNIVNGMQHASDPIPEPDLDFSQEKQNALLYQHWYGCASSDGLCMQFMLQRR